MSHYFSGYEFKNVCNVDVSVCLSIDLKDDQFLMGAAAGAGENSDYECLVEEYLTAMIESAIDMNRRGEHKGDFRADDGVLNAMERLRTRLGELLQIENAKPQYVHDLTDSSE